MAIFGKKKSSRGKDDDFVPPIDVSKIDTTKVLPPRPLTYEIEDIADKSENVAPVFIKVSKYKDIVNNVNYLKMGFNLMRNQMAILSKLENLQKENMKLMYSVIEKINKKIEKLDSDFSRPIDFMKEVSDMKMDEIEDMGHAMKDLKLQISKLKNEVEAMS